MNSALKIPSTPITTQHMHEPPNFKCKGPHQYQYQMDGTWVCTCGKELPDKVTTITAKQDSKTDKTKSND